MDILKFLGGNGLFLLLGVALVVIYIINRNRNRR